MRANIGYGVSTSHTAYGTIGIKVWVYTGETASEDGKPIDQSNKEKVKKS